ncbi:MAG: histidinol dehydrogenase [Pseudomonadota bacterium]
MRKLYWEKLSEEEKKDVMCRPSMDESNAIDSIVKDIIQDIQHNGDQAVRSYSKKFDKVELNHFQVTQDELENAAKQISPNSKNAIDQAYENIRSFHLNQGYQPYDKQVREGVTCMRRVVPIQKVGLYVPGGTAPLVSTTLMNGIPSQIARSPLRILCSPPDQNGTINPHILYAASLCGIDTIFKIGGAQAVAAMAYGTQTIPAVDKIFGPGNAYVTAAKKIVSMDVNGAALDIPAGPSEVCVIADETAHPDFVAADLLSQAEHDVLSQVLLITTSDKLADNVISSIDKQVAQLSRNQIASEALQNSHIIIAQDIEEAITISNDYAPEHLILNFENAKIYTDKIVNAGSVFIGAYTPESAGDYCSGTNHVLPTYGYAKNYSGLNVEAFQKTITMQEITKEGLESISKTVISLANLEGLDAHAKAVSIRMEQA